MFGLVLISLAFAQQPACPDGQERSELTRGACCWTGQAHNGVSCVGIPRCPDGWQTLPDRCVAPERKKPVRRPAPVVTRNVVFAGADLSGQRLFVGEVELGKLPNAFSLPLGEHAWSVRNARDEVLSQGQVKVRAGEGDQVVRVTAPDPELTP